jgi:sarcosine oxidase gamma subunit
MEFSHSEGDLDISLLGPDEFLVGSATSTTDDETVSTTAETSGQHYIRPYVFSGAPNSYELDVRIS